MRALALTVAFLAAYLSAPAGADARLAAWTDPALMPFRSDDEIRHYLSDLRAEARSRDIYWARTAEESRDTIVFPGSPASPRGFSDPGDPAGVDHGRRAARVGRFIVVLADNRLFSIDSGEEGSEALVLADRIDLHPEAPAERGYGEMTISGERIFVFGRSRRAFEIAAFRLLGDGRFERTGTAQVEASGDHYNLPYWDAAASGDRLIVYAPIGLSQLDAGQRLRLPVVRSGGAGRRPLLAASAVYRPLVRSVIPTLHGLIVCDLAGAGLDARACRATGVVAPRGGLAFVDGTDAFVWARSGFFEEDEDSDLECPPEDVPRFEEVPAGTIYRVPLDGGAPSVLAVRGFGYSRPAVAVAAGQLRALVGWIAPRCAQGFAETSHLAYAAIPLVAFGQARREAPRSGYAVLPSMPGEVLARLTPSHLAVSVDREYVDDEQGDDIPIASRLVVVPLDRPSAYETIALPHNVVRIVPLADGLLLTGYPPDRAGLSVSAVALGREPRLSSSVLLRDREDLYQRDGERQRIGSRLALGGGWTLAVPTKSRGASLQSGRRASDMEVLAFGGDGRIRPAGRLESRVAPLEYDDPRSDGERDEDAIPGYTCLAECVLWMDRAAPFFVGERILALTATELIEGRLENGRLREVRRLNYVAARPSRR